MQFHARPSGARRSPRGAEGTGGVRSLRAESELLPLQPGRLLAIKQQAHRLQQLQQHGSPVSPKKSNQRTSEAIAKASSEPINYLKLRRTDESARALQRNRAQHAVAGDILNLSASASMFAPSKQKQYMKESLLDQKEALQRMDQVLAELQHSVLDVGASKARKVKETAPFLAGHLQQLYLQQAHVERESEAAAHRVEELLIAVRNDISLMYKFTPLFKIYARHKVTSAWLRWGKFVLWHRDEQVRIAQLWPYAVKIQRVFRTKRSRWMRARIRMAHAWQSWRASQRIQRCVRAWLRRREHGRVIEINKAILLQAAWRGSRDRRWVKKALQDQLRRMLRLLTPTGNLHRLHELSQRNPELAKPLNAILSLVEETSIVVDSDTTYKARNARVAAINAARPVEATNKQLFRAVFDLSDLIAKRERNAQDAKAEYNRRQQAKRVHEQLKEYHVKAGKLQTTREKLAAENENARMHNEELLMREYLRMLRTADKDRILHVRLDQTRREQTENALMVIEEYQTRYVIAETRRRKQDDEQRLLVVQMRHQFLQERKEQQARQLAELLRTDEIKRNELRARRIQAKAEENELWSKMSKEQQKEALRRLELKEKLAEEEYKRMEAIASAHQAQEREAIRRLEESRLVKQTELESECESRMAMAEEDRLSKRVHYGIKKAAHADIWRVKREKEQVRYSLDPTHFDKIQALKELEEMDRGERYWMKHEDEKAAKTREKERKAQYFEACRLRRKQEKSEATRADKERSQMEVEDAAADARRVYEQRLRERALLLEKMETLAKREESKRQERVDEAKNRKLLHDEEMYQRRTEWAIIAAYELREKRERELMGDEDSMMRTLVLRLARENVKRFRERCIFNMMKEDIASMARQDVEEEGHRLEKLLWKPDDIAAFSQLVVEYPQFLQANVLIVKDLTGLMGPPPFDFDYEAVHRHKRDEAEMPLDKVPRKKRRPRKFFYHEFFEDDPVLAKLKPPSQPPSKARERWSRLAAYYLGQTWSQDSVRKAYLLLSERKFSKASASMLEAVRMAEASSTRQSSMSLLRQVARCYFKQWQNTFESSCLDKALFYMQRASNSIGALANPRFLQEIATVLEKACRYREAAEVISGIINCFPRYPNLNEVIFRGGVIMLSLKMYQQSRDYLLHTLEARPFGWQKHEVLFLAARVMQLEGKLRRKLCSVAYEESFRTNKTDAYYRVYPTWKEWIKASSTWRDVGDKYYHKQEFALARDAYQVMMRQTQKSHAPQGNSKRKQIFDARKVPMHDRADTGEKLEDGDWLRLARCAATLNDRRGAVSSLRQWFRIKSYRERVLDQFYSWPMARWKLLGVDVPPQVAEMVELKKRRDKDAEDARMKAVEDKRLSVLRQRSIKARRRMIAWADEPPIEVEQQVGDTPVITSSLTSASEPDQIGPWRRIREENAEKTYYWNEETGDVQWDPPLV